MVSLTVGTQNRLSPCASSLQGNKYERFIFCVGMKPYSSLPFDGFAEGTACCYKGFSRLNTRLVSLVRDPQGQ